eukprot:4490314-Pyramimonas_sp.AAC.1
MRAVPCRSAVLLSCSVNPVPPACPAVAPCHAVLGSELVQGGAVPDRNAYHQLVPCTVHAVPCREPLQSGKR